MADASTSPAPSPPEAFCAGHLTAVEQRRQRRLRGRWFRTWKQLAKKDRRRWMR